MREFKLRVWCKASRQLLPVRQIDFTTQVVYPEDAYNGLYFNKCELMQFTGFKDLHGIEIYEGDILNDLEYDTICKVDYDETNAAFCLRYLDQTMSEFIAGMKLKVLANIYENPEIITRGGK